MCSSTNQYSRNSGSHGRSSLYRGPEQRLLVLRVTHRTVPDAWSGSRGLRPSTRRRWERTCRAVAGWADPSFLGGVHTCGCGRGIRITEGRRANLCPITPAMGMGWGPDRPELTLRSHVRPAALGNGMHGKGTGVPSAHVGIAMAGCGSACRVGGLCVFFSPADALDLDPRQACYGSNKYRYVHAAGCTVAVVFFFF